MARYIMLQGTSSHVGKSIVATALCRIFHQEGQKVAPFKAQNMALNSYVTRDGLEIGRAQVAQAEAAGVEPDVDMNPILLKPTGNSSSQVILNGRPFGNMSARDYHAGFSLKAFPAVTAALDRLAAAYDTIVIEGAGSPAEVNLKDYDIVNMRVAKYAHAPVLLVTDIDRGGSLAALVGTLELLDEEERNLVKGLVINKFRGDVTLFTPAVDFLEEKTGKPVLGIIPYIEDIGIDDEDSVSLDDKVTSVSSGDLNIAVIALPKISNFTDFDSLSREGDANVYYVHHVAELGNPDVIILPGSKNTIGDMAWLGETGLASAIMACHDEGIPVVGICGGYQMLGCTVSDPQHEESDAVDIAGFGFLPMNTIFEGPKETTQVEGVCRHLPFLGRDLSAGPLTGYEIHMGQSCPVADDAVMPFAVTSSHDGPCEELVGMASSDGLCWGTYIHGLFDNDDFRRLFLDTLRAHKGLEPVTRSYSFAAEKERHYDRLARIVKEHLDMERVWSIMEEMKA